MLENVKEKENKDEKVKKKKNYEDWEAQKVKMRSRQRGEQKHLVVL